MASALIEAHAISKRYGNTDVITGVSLKVMPREIMTLMGPNGAGKTTLLKLLLGLEAPDSGQVTRATNLRLGYVPQTITPPTSMPMHAAYFLSLYAKADASIIHRLGIDPYLYTPLSALSGGQWQRVLLARALSSQPQLLVLDEPTQGIDVHGQAEFYALIEAARRDLGCAVLMVSHDMHVVMAASDKVVCVQHHICCEGTPQHVQDDPVFKAMFGHDLAEKLALYHHHHTHRHDDSGAVVSLTHDPHAGCNHG